MEFGIEKCATLILKSGEKALKKQNCQTKEKSKRAEKRKYNKT